MPGFAPDAVAQESVVFVAPHWQLEKFGAGALEFRTKPGLVKVLTTPNITFDITYEDPAGQGFFHPTLGPERQDRFEDALTYVSNVLNIEGDIEVRVEPSLNVNSGTLASAGTFFSATPGFTNGTAFARLQSGNKPFANFPEIRVICNFGYNWNTTINPPAFNQFDFLTVMIHELTHGFGFLSLANDTGASLVSNSVYSNIDSRIVRVTGMKNMWAGSPPTFQGTVTDLKSNDLGFNGANAIAQYAQGVLPGIYAPNPFRLGSSLAHYNTGNIVGGAIMEHAFPTGLQRRAYSGADYGALLDLGYTNAVEVDPIGEGEGEGEAEVSVPVTVTLTDADASLPINGATVRLDPTNELLTPKTGGKYSITITQTGTYKVSANATGYKAVQSGNFQVNVGITSVNTPLALDPFPDSKIGVSPNNSFDFGTADVNTPLDADFTVQNTGGGQISGKVTVTGTGFQALGNVNYTLAKDAQTTFTLRFTPNAAGSFTGSASFSGGANGPLLLNLSGTGKAVAPPPSSGGCGTIAPPAQGPWGRIVVMLLIMGALVAMWGMRGRAASFGHIRG